MKRRDLRVGITLGVLASALWAGQASIERSAIAQNRDAAQAPAFEVDPFWPRPLPNHWLLGSTIGVAVDDQDHVWIVHRGAATLNPRTENTAGASPKIAEECCVAAPAVLAFDPAGNLARHWGGPGQGYDWPESNHGIAIDHKGNVWIGANGGPDSHVLKFTRDGKFLAQYGKAGARLIARSDPKGPKFAPNSHDPHSFGRVAKIFIEPKAGEAYLADGYLNKRVAVIDAESGKMKRYWGAYGKKPDDGALAPYSPDAPPSPQFGNPVHCADLSNDGLLYVCDRPNDRIQVFKPDGTFVKEAVIAKKTLGSGSVWDLAFSRDPGQRYLYVADGVNQKVHILERDSLTVLTSFGSGGRQPSQFFGVHSIATDSKGNLYTTETYEGKRVQKFVFKGVGPVTTTSQGVAWPRR